MRGVFDVFIGARARLISRAESARQYPGAPFVVATITQMRRACRAGIIGALRLRAHARRTAPAILATGLSQSRHVEADMMI